MEKLYKVREAAEALSVSEWTIRRWDREGVLHCTRTPGGQRRISQSELDRLSGKTPAGVKRAAMYTRVSSHDQKKKGDLERQQAYLRNNIGTHFHLVYDESDVASGLNDKRKGLMRLMRAAADGEFTDLFIRHKERLTRFGFYYLEEYFRSHGVEIHVVDTRQESPSLREELVDDLMAILTSFSGKMYGLRAKENRLLQKKWEEAVLHDEDVSNRASEGSGNQKER